MNFYSKNKDKRFEEFLEFQARVHNNSYGLDCAMRLLQIILNRKDNGKVLNDTRV